MSFTISPITPSVAALAADLGVALQAGTVVTAQVLQVLDSGLVRIAIANLTLDVSAAKPLQQGQVLQLAVTQSANGLLLTPVAADAPVVARAAAVVIDDIPLAPRAPNQALLITPTLTSQESRAVAAAAQSAVTKQAGLSPLFAHLSTAMTTGSLPPPVALAAAQLLGLRLPGDRILTGADIKAALQSSGLMMEASLSSSTNTAPDMKAALIVLRQTLATWLGQSGAALTETPEPKMSAMAQPTVPASAVETDSSPDEVARTTSVKVVAATLQSMIAAVEISEPKEAPELLGGKSLLAAQLIATALRGSPQSQSENASSLRRGLAPPVRDSVLSAQPVAPPPLVSDSSPSGVARQLLVDTEGALARQVLLQVASLPDRVDAQTLRSEAAPSRWNFEIPFVTAQGTAIAQFEIARDESQQFETAQRVWRARFSLDVEPAGPVHALIAFGGDSTSVKMWAERPATAAELRANVGQLGRSLDRAELNAGDIVVSDGAPPGAKPPSAGHFLSRAT